MFPQTGSLISYSYVDCHWAKQTQKMRCLQWIAITDLCQSFLDAHGRLEKTHFPSQNKANTCPDFMIIMFSYLMSWSFGIFCITLHWLIRSQRRKANYIEKIILFCNKYGYNAMSHLFELNAGADLEIREGRTGTDEKHRKHRQRQHKHVSKIQAHKM